MTNSAKPTSQQLSDLAALLDQVIPQSDDGRLPAAGELGLALGVFAAVQGDPASQQAVSDGLAALAQAAATEGAASFAALSEERRLAVLRSVTDARPEFLGSLLIPTYAAYYANPKVVRALGIESWPPHPGGFPLETGDLSLLDPVRERGRRYR